MNSERRHQLERNELADKLGSGINAAQSMLPLILGGLVILVVGSIAWGLYSVSAKKKESAAWAEYYFNLAGGDADAFMDVADGFPSSNAAGWARLTAADSYLAEGIDAMYRNRAEGEELVQQAIDAFESVVANAPNDELKAKAVLGLAQANETLANLDEAKKYYQQVTALSPSPKLLSAVNERLAFLDSDAGQSFYTWFDGLNPKPDAAIELPSNLSLPPTFESSGLDFGSVPSALPTDFGSADAAPAASDGTDTPDSNEPAAEIDPATLPELPNMDAPESASPSVEGSEGASGLDLPAQATPAQENSAQENPGQENSAKSAGDNL